MDDGENSSWLRRSKFSNAVYRRSDSFILPSSMNTKPEGSDLDSPELSNLTFFPTSLDEYKMLIKKSSSSLEAISDNSNPGSPLNPAVLRLKKDAIDSDLRKPSLLLNKRERRCKPNKRCMSPMPIIRVSETFEGARSDGKRFLSPQSKKYDANDDLVFSKDDCKLQHFSVSLSPRFSSPLKYLSSMKSIDKDTSKRGTSWSRCFDHRIARVTAVETGEEWMVDLSKLYLGLKFASGAHSRLYQGIYKDQPVAVKIIRQPEDDENGEISSQLEKQYTRETSILSHLHHRNVIKLVGACKNPPVFCILTEYLSGGSLRSYLHKSKNHPLPLEKLIAIALDVARGMEYIHSQGVIHRDLKPENILFNQDSCLKIVDFGIACEDAECDALSEDHGTYRWMAPEMIKHKPYGRKVDVYSFGLLLWELATGKIPYEDMTPVQAAFAVIDKKLRPVVPPTCPSQLGALMEQCWSTHPEKRPEFWQVVKALEQFRSSLDRVGDGVLAPPAVENRT